MATAKPWDPMADAYKNKDFNKYETGPGCELDDNAQPGAIAANGHRNSVVKYKLCFKNVPSEMTDKALENLCSHYGKVTSIYRAQRVNLIFISFQSLGDMERVLTALKDNPQHGIQVSVARESQSLVTNNTKDGNTRNSLNNSSEHNSSGSNQIDMARRSIKGPFTNPRRPGPMPRKPLVTDVDYEISKLKDVDPQKHFLIQYDMHDNDRNNHNRRSNSQGKGKKNVHTGRGYYVESKKTIEKLQKLSQSSQGSYNAEKNEYVKSGLNVDSDEKILGDCILCNKPSTNVCQRCGDFYCSVECQKRDWQRHRHICFQMPSLIKPTCYYFKSNSDVPSETSSLVSLQNTSTVSSRSQTIKKNETIVNNTQKIGLEKNNNNKNQDQRPSTSQSQGKNASNQNVQQKPNMQGNRNQNAAAEQQKQNLRGDSIQNKNENNLNISTNQKQVMSGEKQIEHKESKKETKVEAPPTKQNMILEKSQVPSSGSSVAVTSAKTCNLFYIRSLAPEDNIEYIKGLNIVINESKNSKFIEKMPERGDLLVADYQETGYYRVLVINPLSDEEILVAYVDFGNVEKKKLSELKELSPAAYNLKRYTIPVRLKDVPMLKPNDATQEYLNSFVDTTKEIKIIYEGNGENVEVELIDISNNENVNKVILKLMDINVPTDNDPPVFLKDIPMKLLPAGEKVPEFVFDNSLIQTGVISCIHENDVIPLEGFNSQLQEYAKKDDQPYTPREGELTTANMKDIRKYPKEFTHPSTSQSQGKNASNQNVQQKPNMQGNINQNAAAEQQKQNLKGDSIQNKTENNLNISTNQKQAMSGEKQIEHKESKKETKVEAPPTKQNIILEKSQVPSSGSSVAVTSAKTCNLFYIRSLAPEDNIEYIKGLNIVINESKNSKFIEKMPERGDLLVADYQETGYYRVLVINPLSDEEILVAYVDFGNVEKKKLSELKELPPAAYNLKRYTVPVRLKDVPMLKPNDATQEYLNSFVDTTKEIKIIYEGNGENVEVELIDISNNENVNKVILKLMDINVPTDNDPPVFLKDILMKLLPAGEKVPVFVFDNSLIQTGVISCIHENDVIPLEGFNSQLQEYAKKDDQPYTPREDELCLVKYEDDGVWYRAECLEVVGDQNPSVIFIDYGNLTTANIKNIRKYPKEFTHPCTTSLCLIEGLPETINITLANRLKELIPMNDRRVLDKVSVQKDEQGEETNIVFLPNVISTLEAEKLI